MCLLTTAAFAITDITFFATSDIHYGQDNAANNAGRALTVTQLNTLAGMNYPTSVGGGKIAEPRGVVIPGDLTDYPDKALWARFTTDYSPLPGKAKMKYGAYDGMGNHELINYYTNPVTYPTLAKEQFIQRNLLRKGMVNFDSANYHYSWDWDQVHFLELNLFGGNTNSRGTLKSYKAYEFAKADLEKNVGTSGRPVFVMEHYPMDTDNWTVTDKTLMVTLLKKYNCIGILHGHSHSKHFYTFQGLDIFDDGTSMKTDILVFHITEGRMAVVNREGTAWGALVLEKAITMGKSTTAARPQLNGSVEKMGDFKFNVAGVGRIWAGNRRATSVEIRSASGQLLCHMRVSGSNMTWNRHDDAGREVPPGIYLARIATDAGVVNAKVALP